MAARLAGYEIDIVQIQSTSEESATKKKEKTEELKAQKKPEDEFREFKKSIEPSKYDFQEKNEGDFSSFEKRLKASRQEETINPDEIDLPEEEKEDFPTK